MSAKTGSVSERYRDDYLKTAPRYSKAEKRDAEGKITLSPHGLTKQQRSILMAIISHFYSKTVCWPSQATLSGITGISESTIRREMRKLEALDLLVTTHRGTAGNHQANIYRLEWEAYFERVEYYQRDDELAALRAKRADDLAKAAEAFLKVANATALDRSDETSHRSKTEGSPVSHSDRRNQLLEFKKEIKTNGSDLDLAKGSISLPTDEPYIVSKLGKQYLASMRAGLKTQASTPPSKVIIEPEPPERAISSSLDGLITQNSEQTEWQTPQNPQT